MKKDCNVQFSSNLRGGGRLKHSLVDARIRHFCHSKLHTPPNQLPPVTRIAVAYTLYYFHNYPPHESCHLLAISRSSLYKDLRQAEFTLTRLPRKQADALRTQIETIEAYILYNAKYIPLHSATCT